MKGGAYSGPVPGGPPAGGLSVLAWAAVDALARAIGSHGGQVPGQLRRVAAYAVEIGRRMGLDDTELDSLWAASLLHDIGELALPHHVLSPTAEFNPDLVETLKLHPTVGAAIVEQMAFPFPVAPLVRGHHERWDGSGYPDGLAGEAIPLGARILSVAVPAGSLPPADARERLRAGAGTAFDPAVVGRLIAGAAEIERRVRAECGEAEGQGFEAAIAAARHEERVLWELTAELGNSLSLSETLSSFDKQLRRLIRYRTIVFYVPGEDRLSPAFISGAHRQQFCSIEVPFGLGISGRVARARQPMIHSATAEDGWNDVPAGGHLLASALAMPLEARGELVGVLTLYQAAPDAFSPDDLRVLLAIRAKLAASLENALQHERAEQLTVVDQLTCLPNERALFLRLDAELARCRRRKTTLAVLVCEVDGLRRVHPRVGQVAGRRLHLAIANGLRRICREDDCVARLGEGFVLVLSDFGPRHLKDKRQMIDSLMQEMSSADLGGSLLAARVGAAFYPEDGAYTEDLLAAADSRLRPGRQLRRHPESAFTVAMVELAASLDCPSEVLDVPRAPAEADGDEP